jgi:RNA polymerase subunit RPABC4/transcription elongation factor Spt4
MSTFKPNALGTAAAAAGAVSSLLGGIFGRAAQGAEQLQQMVAGPQHDSALRAAVDEIRPLFKQCTRCGNWVCGPVCWNEKAGLCETCAPDLQEEIASAQAHAAREQAMEKARNVDFIGQRDLSQVSAISCTNCGAKTGGAKFCPECGTPTVKKKSCGSCGAVAEGSPKFCPDCGTPFTG